MIPLMIGIVLAFLIIAVLWYVIDQAPIGEPLVKWVAKVLLILMALLCLYYYFPRPGP
jgi:hypothetical protein